MARRPTEQVQRTAPAPMLATLGKAPASGENVATEIKWDGQRAIVAIDGETTRVWSRNGADITRTFPELAGVAEAVGGRPMILDGEIVALDAHGRPSFTRLQRRWPQQRRPDAALLREVPVRLMGFDVIEHQGRSVAQLPWHARRTILESVSVVDRSPVFTVPQAFTDVSPTDMLAVAASHALEGIVIKPLDSPYISGRSGLWTKVPIRLSADLVIVGFWSAGGPGGRSAVGSLLLAGHNSEGNLVPVSQCGTGFSSNMRRYLFDLLDPTMCEASPLSEPVEAAGVRYVTPTYVGEVAYREYVPGRWMRHPSWKGLRQKPVREVGLPATSPSE
ncbi:ATP-dependent DNA ligase [Mycolicibacterium hodleri]|uniref:ATP-dependent DNA ligase n=1 Tax=Mycolicibacterium hodleri TaxID=49897 RepID=UPI0021F29B41|nr:DNA ligase [Mycolicibacterium hodleri]